jgi:hypothetical protein
LEIEQQGFIEQDTALESMRASDFDCYSAYGEVVDNSIQANASDIRIEIEPRKDTAAARFKKIGRVLFADNGDGMDIELLHRCLKLGHSSRYNDRSGIGRFGVGMTLGAIHECQRIEVYSKATSGTWLYTYLDLKEIANGKLKFIPRPIEKQPKESIAEYITKSGTLVIWSKYDKQVDKYEDIISESKFWLGRTFRKFIWGEAKGYGVVKITLNKEDVPAFDPLYVNKSKTGFENEPKAELLEPNEFQWTIPLSEKSKKQKSKIIINMSLLPDEYRREGGLGGDKFARDRHINRNEGLSILRNDREVFYGFIPHMRLATSEADQNVSRFIGCEICFDAELDQEFAVKNIKRGAVPVRELKTTIRDMIYPTFNSKREFIRNRWSELKREKEEDTNSNNKNIGVSGEHGATNAMMRAAKKTLLQGDREKPEEVDKSIARKIKPDASDSELQKVIEGLRENGITIDEKEFIGDSFIDMDHGNKLKTLFYNTNSTFYKSYRSILEELSKKDKDLSIQYKVLMDLIFVGYMLAEAKIDPEEEIDGASFTAEIKQNWALILSKILKKWNQ